jgi:uncharacterized protein (TIGR02453 family)
MIEPETFTFLTDLAANNRKIWMDENREDRDDALRNFTGIASTLHDYADRFNHDVAAKKSKPKQSYSKFVQEARDRNSPGLYRTDIDVFANAGNPFEKVGYYLHIEPGNCYAGAGLSRPSKETLARMRSRLMDDPQGIIALENDTDFKTAFPEGITTRKALNVVPDGFDISAPTLKYLKMVGLECRAQLTEEELLDDDVIYKIIEVFRSATPLVRYFE